MKIEQQVVNLKLSKKLKKLGVKQKSLWYWWASSKEIKPYIRNRRSVDFFLEKNRPDMAKKAISAFTVAELGEILPEYDVSYYKEDNDWRVGTYLGKKFGDPMNVWDKSEANARAKMLIYLIEKKLV